MPASGGGATGSDGKGSNVGNLAIGEPSPSPFLFGYAKPVPVNFRKLRSPRRDMVLVAAAGPATNFLLGVLAALAFDLVDYLPVTAPSAVPAVQ